MASGLMHNCTFTGTNLASQEYFRGQPLRLPIASFPVVLQKRYTQSVEADLERSPGNNSSYSRVPGTQSSNSATNRHLHAVPPIQNAPESKQRYHNEIQTSTLNASDLWLETLQRAEQFSQKPTENEQMNEWIEEIRDYFRKMSLGEISVSAYDTAWVARVPALDGSPGPQFPKCLQWIVDHQLPDGDWGEPALFLGFDRVCSTLACIIALQTWGVGAQNVELD